MNDASPKFSMVPLGVAADTRLKARDWRVLAALCSFRGSASDFVVWPSRQAIAARCGGMHVDQVSRILGDLKRLGWITIQQTRGASRYTITHPSQETVTTAEHGIDPDTLTPVCQGIEKETLTPVCQGSPDTRMSGLTLTPVCQTEETKGRDQEKRPTPLTPQGGRKAPESEDQAEAPETFTLAPETAAPKAAKPKKVKRGEMTPEVAERFAAFWRSYPKKVGKPEAAKAFAKVAPDAEQLVSMLAAVEAQHRAYRADPKRWRADGTLDKSYIPNASTWLNQQRWDDEVEDAPEVEQPNAQAVLEAWAEAFPADPAQPVAAFRLTASARDLHAHWNAHGNHKDPNFWFALFEVARTDPALQEHRSRGRMTLAWALSERGFSQLLTALIARQSRARMEARNAA